MNEQGRPAQYGRFGTRVLPRLGPRGEGWVGLQTALGVLVIVTAALTGPAWSGLPRAVTDVAGVALIAAGIGLFAWGAMTLGRSFSIWLSPTPGAHFVEAGPYRRLRHPICTGQGILFLGWALLAASPVGIVLDLVYLGYLDLFKLPAEEATLRARYPEYAAYAERVAWKLAPHIV